MQKKTKPSVLLEDEDRKIKRVRNFYVQVDIDGTKLRHAMGPADPSGGFRTEISIRSQGKLAGTKLLIEGRVLPLGRLVLRARITQPGMEPEEHVTVSDADNLYIQTER